MERLRRSMMFVPGNNAGMLRDAYIYGSDSLMFDLEDSVALAEKDAARLLVYHMLKTIAYGNCELVVRVNGLHTPYGVADVEAMVRAGAHVIRCPKTDTAQDIFDMDQEITRVERAAGITPGRTGLMAAIESAAGVLNAQEICAASPRLIGVALGAEDYTANIKTARTKQGDELLFARNMILVAARAAGIAAVDTVFADVDDMEGLEAETRLIKTLGFDGKSIINPRQIDVVHRVFMPTREEIASAQRIVEALEEAKRQGAGVMALNGRMIDRPVLLRAQHVLSKARASGLLPEEEEV